MALSKIFSPDHILTSVHSLNKEELFDEMLEALCQQEGFCIDVSEIRKTLWARENLMNTGIAPGVALPHTQVKGLDSTKGVLALIPQGLEYGSLDGQPVQMVMLFVDDVEASVQHLMVLRDAAILIKDPRFLKRMVKSSTPQEAWERLVEFEDLNGLK